MKVIKGDLLKLADEGKFDVIIHGCNCFCAMGAGIALQIRNKYPEAYRADKQTEQGDINKLGSYSSYTYPNGLTVVNAYTQYMPGYNDLRQNYRAIDDVMKQIVVDFEGKKIGLPLIGAGLAGGDWNIIRDIIKNNLKDKVDYTIVEYSRG